MTGKVAIYTLGCKVNQYESRALGELLEKEGVVLVSEQADACIINTCAVTSESERKARQTVRRAINENPGAYILVTGCAGQIAASSFLKIQGVDFVNGNRDKKELVGHVLSYLSKKEKVTGCTVKDLCSVGYEKMEVSSAERTRAYMKVEDGCESKCAYCIIPTTRGPICSRPLAECVAEAKRLVEAGYREIVLTGVEISAYGKDLEDTDTADLILALDRIEGLERIRLSSVDPSFLRPAFVDRVASCRKLVPHFHLSLQSGCDATLNRMRRKYNTEQVRRNVGYMRGLLPDLRFTADIIVGFPGETDEEFEKTCAFLGELELLHVHVFTYSRRPGTEADRMEDQVPDKIKKERSVRLISCCSEIRDRVLQGEIGREYEVLFEEEKQGNSFGHTVNFIEVCVDSKRSLHGEVHLVRLEKVENGVMLGKLV